MRKYRITVQRTFFKADEIVDSSNRTQSFEFDEIIEKVYEETLITEQNIEIVRKLGLKYNIGDIMRSPLMSIKYKVDNEIKSVDVWADPYYLLEIDKDGSYQVEEKHSCSN